MKIKRFMFLLICAALLFTGIAPAYARDKEERKVDDAITVLTEIMKIPEEGLPEKLLNDAYGVAVIPGVIKVGFILGGRRGHGILVTKDKHGKWSNPSFITLTGGSLGFQIGAQSTDVILVFKNNKSIDGIIKGKFTLGADAAVAAGPIGRRAEMSTDLQLKAEIFSYSRSRGLFAGLALEGSSLSIDEKSNEAFYNNEDLTAKDILSSKRLKAPAVAEEFRRLLKEYSDMKLKEKSETM